MKDTLEEFKKIWGDLKMGYPDNRHDYYWVRLNDSCDLKFHELLKGISFVVKNEGHDIIRTDDYACVFLSMETISKIHKTLDLLGWNK